jgi:hypothetical protein
MLASEEIDLGLVPVAVLPKLPEYHIVGDHRGDRFSRIVQ